MDWFLYDNGFRHERVNSHAFRVETVVNQDSISMSSNSNVLDTNSSSLLFDETSSNQDNSFNNFEYWRTPILNLDISTDDLNESETDKIEAKNADNTHNNTNSSTTPNSSEAVRSYVIIEADSSNTDKSSRESDNNTPNVNDEKPPVQNNVTEESNQQADSSEHPESDSFISSPTVIEEEVNKSSQMPSSFVDVFSAPYSTNYSDEDNEKLENQPATQAKALIDFEFLKKQVFFIPFLYCICFF